MERTKDTGKNRLKEWTEIEDTPSVFKSVIFATLFLEISMSIGNTGDISVSNWLDWLFWEPEFVFRLSDTEQEKVPLQKSVFQSPVDFPFSFWAI
jgi:hypothetical protein